MAMVVTQPCIGCKHKNCVTVCPVDSFHEGEQMLFVNPEQCIDCEACIPECPVGAIYHESNVPPDMYLYIAINAQGAKRFPVAR